MKVKLVAGLVGSLLALSAHAQSVIPPNQMPGCPALGPGGGRLSLSPPLSTVTFVRDDAADDLRFRNASALSERIVTFFETGQIGDGAGYGSFSAVDGLSVGKLQWNWKSEDKGTLVTEFFQEVTLLDLFEIEDVTLEEHILALWQLAHGGGDLDRGRDAVAYLAGQPAQSPFADWLNTPGVRAVQDRLIEDRKVLSYVLTQSWIQARGYPAAEFERVFLVMNNFNTQAGLNPSQGGLRGVWAPQVQRFRDGFSDRRQMFDYILRWVNSCKGAAKVNRVLHGAYMFDQGRWGQGNVARWGNRSFINGLSEAQVDLFAFAYLYSMMSINAFQPGKPGDLQLLVFNRGGSLALGTGVAHAEVYDEDRF